MVRPVQSTNYDTTRNISDPLFTTHLSFFEEDWRNKMKLNELKTRKSEVKKKEEKRRRNKADVLAAHAGNTLIIKQFLTYPRLKSQKL